MQTDFGTLLYTGYQYGHSRLDLYGLKANEDHGFMVTAAKRSGTTLDVTYFLNEDVLECMGEWLDEQHSQAYRTGRIEARVERAAHDRQMAESDHLWRSL